MYVGQTCLFSGYTTRFLTFYTSTRFFFNISTSFVNSHFQKELLFLPVNSGEIQTLWVTKRFMVMDVQGEEKGRKTEVEVDGRNLGRLDTEAVFYAETRPPVLWTGKTKCGRVLICLDGSGRVKKNNNNNCFYFFILMYHVSSTQDCSERFTQRFTRHVIVILYRHVYIS